VQYLFLRPLGRRPLKKFFEKKSLAEIDSKFSLIEAKADKLVYKYVSHNFKNTKAGEYAKHGFARRVGTLRRCIENVFRIVPARTVKISRRARLLDAQINLQAPVANVYGAVDNLAWVWVCERGIDKKLNRKKVGFRKGNRQVRVSLSTGLRKYLESIDEWLDYVIEYRDSLAHRIPLYIPPGGVSTSKVERYNELIAQVNAASARVDSVEFKRLLAESDKLLVFRPLMTHSVNETTAHYPFHVQMICDFLTIEELGLRLLAEIEARDRA
jgi:hypothetical protein